MNEHKRRAIRAPWQIRKCPSCELEFHDWEAQYNHAREAVHLVAESCTAQHVQTGKNCEKGAGHQGQHAYLGSAKAILWGRE